jgi:hypothetical protein
MKALLNPIPRLIIGGVFLLIAFLDAAMHKNCDWTGLKTCLSFIGLWSAYIVTAVILSFVITQILFPLVKWVVNSVKV